MRINRFVLDNNIWVSYFITKKEDKLLQIIEKNELTVYSCDELVLGLPQIQKARFGWPFQKLKIAGTSLIFLFNNV